MGVEARLLGASLAISMFGGIGAGVWGQWDGLPAVATTGRQDTSSTRPACCPTARAPMIHSYPAVYRLTHGRWQQASVLEPGDPARFVLLFRRDAAGWQFPSASLRVQRVARDGLPYGPTIYALPMRRERRPNGYTRFSVPVRLQSKLAGQFLAAFDVSNGTGATQVTVRFKVTPMHP